MTTDDRGFLVPDYAAANKVIEAEYRDILREQYILFRHFHMSIEDMDRLTSEDRKQLIDQLVEEKDQESKASRGSREVPRGPADAAAERG